MEWSRWSLKTGKNAPLRILMAIVKEDHALVAAFEARDSEPRHLVRGDERPVIRREIGAPDRQPLCKGILLNRGIFLEVREPEEWCDGFRVPNGRSHRCDPVRDLFLGRLARQARHGSKVLRVRSNRMALSMNPLHQARS